MTQAHATATGTGGQFLTTTAAAADVFVREDLSDEQRLFGQTASEFMHKEVLPVVEQLYHHDWALTRELLKKASELDLLRLEIPPQYGGLGLDLISASFVGEQIAINPSFGGSLGAPTSVGQLPLVYNHKPTGRGDDYLDLTGQPLFPFGFGLSYTTFEYSALKIEPAIIGPAGGATVHCTIRNTGARAGDEVAQLYIRDVLASVARPIIQLGGFTRLHLEPGEARDVSFTVGREQLRMLDAKMRWVVEPGTFRILVGSSSKDLRLRGDLIVQ